MSEVTSIGPNKINMSLDRVEKIEVAGVDGIRDIDNRMRSRKILKDAFELIRRDPPKAYINFVKLAISQPTSKQEYINRAVLFGRLAGYALMVACQSEDLFNRVMAVNERPMTT